MQHSHQTKIQISRIEVHKFRNVRYIKKTSILTVCLRLYNLTYTNVSVNIAATDYQCHLQYSSNQSYTEKFKT